MGGRHEQIFESIRAEVSRRLADSSGGRAADGEDAEDSRGGGADGADAEGGSGGDGEVFAALADQIAQFLESADAGRYQDAVRRWMAAKLGEGAPAEELLRAVTAIGDTVLAVARERLGYGPDADAFAREAARAEFWAARATVAAVGEELDSRESERQRLAEGAARGARRGGDGE